MAEAATAARTSLNRAAVEELSKRFDEPAWLLQRRLEAWALFEEAPMPDPLSDEWKRTDVGRMTLDGLAPFAPTRAQVTSAAGLPAAVRSVWDEREQLAGRLVQLDSDVVHRQLDDALASQGVVFTDMHTAAREHEDLIREHLMSTVSAGEWKYLGLHGALWSGGCFVYVPAGVEVELPLEYAAALTEPNLMQFPHLLIVAEANSKVTVIQEAVSPALKGLNVVSGAVEVIVKDGAQVQLVDVQRWGRNVQMFSTMRASLSRDATFQGIMLGLGGTMTKTRLDAVMNGTGAHVELLGLFFGDKDQQFVYDTLQDHVAQRTESDLLFKSTLTDEASLVWKGVINVRHTAGQSAANQTSRNLLLSDKASASPTPILEIAAYDVTRCGHGATVGPVDQEQVFYLQSRGIPHDEAERLLVDGFFAEVLERVPSERLQRRVLAVLQSKLGR
ncbi:MAG: Fe-S cluster assembly protein SufD [Chloroflexi bacterium]|nr:Fe-S cluster assembly protein SufD [Chloroflexota bacterium]